MRRPAGAAAQPRARPAPAVAARPGAGAGAAAGGRGGATAGTTGTGGGGAAGTGAAGTGPVATVCNGGPPSPAAGGADFPFPQHRAAGSCIFPPTCSDNDMTMGWAAFKTNLIVSDGGTDGALRVRRPENADDTVSEGISYGMLFAVYMNEKATFDNCGSTSKSTWTCAG